MSSKFEGICNQKIPVTSQKSLDIETSFPRKTWLGKTFNSNGWQQSEYKQSSRNVKAAYYNPHLRFSSGGQSNNYSSKGGNRVKDNEQRSLHSNRPTIVTEVTQVTALFQPKQQSFPKSSKVVVVVEGAMCIYITTFWSDITVIFIRGLLYSNFQW